MTKVPTTKPLALWFLNHRYTEAEAAAQVRFMKEQGFGGYFLHWLNGGEPYMGRRWLAALDSILRLSADAGLEAWLYDEAWCPSGFAGGRVLASRPELQLQRLWWETREAKGGGEETLVFELMEPLSVVAMPLRGGLPCAAEAICLGAELGTVAVDPAEPYRHDWGYYPHGGPPLRHWRQAHVNRRWQLVWRPPAGTWRIYAFFARRVLDFDGNNRVNVLARAATDAFLAETHEVYATHFGHHFGSVIPGIMTDEPKFLPLPWDAGLAAAFEATTGNRLADRLPHLVDAALPGHESVRLTYHRLASELFHEHFIRPLAAWCREHELLLTGHISPEEDPSHEVAYTGSISRHLTQFDIPGEDLIIQAVGNAERAGLNLGPRLASSVARQQGRPRTFSEVGACCEEDVSLADLKHLVDWLLVNGVNLIAWHGFSYSQQAFRKYLAGSTHYRDSNLTRQMHLLNDYIAETAATLAAFPPHRPIAVLQPQSALRVLAVPGVEVDACENVDLHLVALVWGLLTTHCEFDLLDEDGAADWVVTDGALCCGQAQYEVVVVPDCPFVHALAAERLGELLADAGNVVCVGAKPATVAVDGVSEWAAAPTVAASVAATVAAVRQTCPPAVGVSAEGVDSVLAYYGLDSAGQGLSFCLNLAERATRLTLDRAGEQRQLHLSARGSGLVRWGQPLSVSAGCPDAGPRLELRGPWRVAADHPNHVPLTGRPAAISIEAGAAVTGLILDAEEAGRVLESLRIDECAPDLAGPVAAPFYDPGNVCLAAGDLLPPGIHTVAFATEMLPTVLLAGRFAAFRDAGGGWRLRAPEPETTSLERVACGYPFLHGPLSFTTRFLWEGSVGDGLWLHLPARAGYVAAYLDGVYCGACAWQPDGIALPGLGIGEHELRLDVLGSSIGILRGDPEPAGLGSAPLIAPAQTAA